MNPTLSVIVPAYNCAPTLVRAVAAIRASDLPRTQWELIVADDGSTDETSAAAAGLADRVVRLTGGPRGPGYARNAAARVATGDVLVFIDADVCVAPPTLRQFATLFAERSDIGAAFGAYDTTPEAQTMVSQYRNLLHHYVHSLSPGPTITFWAGCGAVRRAVFNEVGGFDAARYPRPQIEDIELGYRLTARGIPILLCPDIQGKHLKKWSLRGGFVTDVRDRGIPWMRLLLERREIAAAGPLNLQRREKIFTAAASAGAGLLFIALLVQSAMIAGAGALLLVVVLVGNAPLLGWFARMRGVAFAVKVAPLRLAYYLLNAVSAVWGILLHQRDSHPASAVRDATPGP